MPKPLYEILPDGRWKLHFDNHSISTLTTCERLFDFRHLRNRGRKGGLAFNTAIGIWWSDVMKDFYLTIKERKAVTLEDISESAMRHWFRHNLERYKAIAPDKYHQFGGADITLIVNGKPANIPLGAVQMAREFYFFHAEAALRDWQIIAAEDSFGTGDDLVVAEDSSVIVCYQGRPDLVILDKQDRLMPVDHKTQDYPNSTELLLDYKPHPQTAGYIFSLNALAEQLGFKNRTVDRCIIMVAGRYTPREPRDKKRVALPRFVQVPVDYSQSELREWQNDILEKGRRLRYCIENRVFCIKEISCKNQYGSRCEFHEVCRRPPEVRDLILQKDFVIIPPWNTARADDRNLARKGDLK